MTDSSDSHVQTEARKPLVNLAREYHVLPVAIVFDLPERLCQDRNRDRPDRAFGLHFHRHGSVVLAIPGFHNLDPSVSNGYRVVFMLRGIEGMSTAETAACLDLSEEAVKVRFHRARSLLREHMDDSVGGTAREAFSFLGDRCASMVARVMSMICLCVPLTRRRLGSQPMHLQ